MAFYVNTLGMTLVERRETSGKNTGMLSAVLDAGTFKIVLIEGLGEQSQVSRFIQNFGQGWQQFSTRLLVGPGLEQIFSVRDPVSRMMYELSERVRETGFQDNNVNQLFRQLEESES